MLSTQQIQIKDYNYDLPDHRIAKYPLAQRDQSKLLTFSTTGTIAEDVFAHLPQFIRPGSLMIFNNTKVIQARLQFQKTTGAAIEIFCLEPISPADYQLSFSATTGVRWVCLVGNLKKWKEGMLERVLCIRGEEVVLTAERLGTHATGFEIRFAWNNAQVSWAEILDNMGELPIPPYLHRDTEESDLVNYQTVYSKVKGSVAAPTAGLHFTPDILQRLDQQGVERDEVTLHVGAGTFKPVKSEHIADHEMHAEWISVQRTTVERLLAHEAQCVAVGTTSVRTLESLYYIGMQIDRCRKERREVHDADLKVAQWTPYAYAASSEQPLTAIEALQAVLDYMQAQALTTLHTSTQIIIAPGYTFKIVRTIITNFHQPQSTLLLLVSAFLKGRWREIYDYALSHDFRFLSYGDSSILHWDN